MISAMGYGIQGQGHNSSRRLRKGLKKGLRLLFHGVERLSMRVSRPFRETGVSQTTWGGGVSDHVLFIFKGGVRSPLFVDNFWLG